MYRLFLERHPGERRRIEDITTRRTIESTSSVRQSSLLQAKFQDYEDESRLYNELEITVLKASGLPLSTDNEPPSSYIHLQLLGHPDKFTNPKPYDANPIFNEKFVFPMITTEQQLRLLRRSKLLISVIDMKVEELDETDGDGIIGELGIGLGEIAEGNSVVSAFSIKDKESKHVAELELSLRWKSSLKKQRDLGPLALSASDVERILSAFDSNGIDQLTVDYVEFCRYVDPPKSVVRAQEILQAYFADIADKECRSPKDILRALFGDSKKITEEEFTSTFLKLNCDIVPGELSDLFKHIDRDNAESINTGEILSNLGLDDVVKLPTSLFEKLRSRVRDLGLKKQYPLKYFEEADSWGVRGHLSRLEFKKVLRKLGFILVDEPEYAADEIPSQHTIAKDSVPSGALENLNEEVLIAKKGDMSAYLRQQRELFEKKLADLQIHSQHVLDQALQNKKDGGESVSALPSEGKEIAIGANLLQTPGITDPFAGVAEHLSGVASMGREVDFPVHVDDPSTLLAKAPSPKVSVPKKLSQSVDIISAEKALQVALSSFDGASRAPDFLRAFLRVDGTHKGFVNRKQFAHVIKQMESLSIKPEELGAFMQFFDSKDGGDEAQIDYNAFVRMSRYQPPENLPTLPLQKVVLNIERIEFIKSFDSTGSRTLRRSDIMRAFDAMGYKSSTLSNAIRLFEANVDGRVNYENLIEFIIENSACSDYDKLVTDLKESILEDSKQRSEGMEKWFRYMDKESRGFFNFQDLKIFLKQRGFVSTRETAGCLFDAMDTDRKGAVDFKEFCKWLLKERRDVSSLAFTSLSVQELKKKSELYFSALLQINVSPDVMMQSYRVYDWRVPPSDSVSGIQFFNATRRLGFPFTNDELRMLCSEFSSGKNDNVNYRKFFEWTLPQKGVTHELPLSAVEKRTSSTSIGMFLEKALQQGVDLISCFGRYDSKNVGRITIDEFCSALADLGLSSTTLGDARGICEQYKAVSGDFVLYRRVVTELLRRLDENTGAEEVDIVDILHSGMQRNKIPLSKLVEILQYYDRKGQGRIRIDDIGTVFEETGLFLRRKELRFILERFSIGDTQWVQYSSLISALEERLGALSNQRVDTSLPDELAVKMRGTFETLILKGVDYRREFDSLDSDFEGNLLRNDFKTVLVSRLKIVLSDMDLNTLMDHYTSGEDRRKVNFLKFISELHPTSLSRLSAEYFDESGQIEAAEELRRLIRRRFPEFAFPGELKRPWRHFAGKSGGKVVGLEEFSVGLQKLGFDLNPDVERGLLHKIRLDDAPLADLSFSYPEFLIFVRDPYHHDVVWKFRRVVSRSGSSEREISMALREQDTNDSGVLTVKQFEKALTACNIHLSESDASRILARFDDEDTCVLNINDFLRFLKGERSERTESRSSLRSTSHEHAVSSSNDLVAWGGLKEKIEDKLISGFTSSEVYSIFSNEGGTVDLASLHHGAREIGLLHLTRAEIRSVLRRMCMAVGAVLDSDSFFRALGVDGSNFGKVPPGKNPLEKKQNDDVKHLLVTVRKDVEAGYRDKDHRIVLEKAFAVVDVDNDGAITLREFTKYENMI